jgi:hypothetical protein
LVGYVKEKKMNTSLARPQPRKLRITAAHWAAFLAWMLFAPSALVQTPFAEAQIQPASSPAQPLQLVTQAEMQASLAAGDAPQVPVARSAPQPGAPRIELVSPDTRAPVSVPTRIHVKFASEAPAEPRPETFKVLYGALRIDITQRLLGVARVTREGILVPDATLPAGKHQLQMILTDSAGRETRQTLAFTVQ